MFKRARSSNFVSGLLGGLVAVAAGLVLLATGVVDTGEDQAVITQQPVTRPAADEGSDGLTVNDIYDRASPGVVFVQAEGGASESPFGPPEGGGGGAATGSGFVLDKEGNVLTNAHIVDRADEVSVRFGEDDVVDAEVVGADLSSDLAVLKVDPDKADLEPLPLGDSKDLEVGDPTIAIGNPFGFDRTVTTGIVSALQRQIQAPNGFSIDNVIQTDASINPGNSGGPLLDAAGRVIGVNSQIATAGSQGNVGIGFAVPSDTVRDVVPSLSTGKSIERPFIGVSTAPPTDGSAGAEIAKVTPGGPASGAGLRGPAFLGGSGGDVIVAVDGKRVGAPEDVSSAIAGKAPGDRVELEIRRSGDLKKLGVTLGERPQSATP